MVPQLDISVNRSLPYAHLVYKLSRVASGVRVLGVQQVLSVLDALDMCCVHVCVVGLGTHLVLLVLAVFVLYVGGFM